MTETTQILRGRAISPGFAEGQAFVFEDILEEADKSYDIEGGEVGEERERVESAIVEAEEELVEQAERVGEALSGEHAEIFDSHRMILRDPQLNEEIRNELDDELINAERAVRRVLIRWERKLRALDSPDFRVKADDLRDVHRRLLRSLKGVSKHQFEELPPGSIVVAEHLLPSDAVALSKGAAAGLVVERGGPASHAALLTRDMGVPAVSGIAHAKSLIAAGTPMLVDGFESAVTLHPDDEARHEFRERRLEWKRKGKEAWASRNEPVSTTSGDRIAVMANIGCQEDARVASDNGADGVGLYRIEHAYLARQTLPGAEELYAILAEALEPFLGKRVTVRLLDLGGDKQLPGLALTEESDPFLGQRGIRLLLEHPDLLRQQLAAVLRLASDHDVRILVPMVTLAEEVRETRQALNEVRGEMGTDALPPLGAMIETPCAALSVRGLLEYADFFSVGTNDLTQYTLAVGRENDSVADYFRDDHPAVMRLLKIAMQEAGSAPVSICGELAADSGSIEALLELGLRNFSVSPARVPLAKQRLREAGGQV